MTCRDNEPLLLAERDGVLTPDQHASLERHLADCPACQQLRARLASAMIAFRDDTLKVPTPDIEQEWQKVRAQIASGGAVVSRKQRPLAPVIWFGTALAAAAAFAFAYMGRQSPAPSANPLSAGYEIAQAEYVEAGSASASTMVYVDKESGWLVVWASDSDAATEG